MGDRGGVTDSKKRRVSGGISDCTTTLSEITLSNKGDSDETSSLCPSRRSGDEVRVEGMGRDGNRNR